MGYIWILTWNLIEIKKFLEENLEIIFLDFDHEIGHQIGNKLYIWVRGAMGNIYLQIVLKSGYLGMGVDFVDFSSGVGNCYKFIS